MNAPSKASPGAGSTRLHRIAVVAACACLAGTLIYAAPRDLALSQSLVVEASKPALWVQRFGELPGVAVGLVAMFVLARSRRHLSPRAQAPVGVLVVGAAAFLTWFGLHIVIGASAGPFGLVDVACVAAVLVGLIGVAVTAPPVVEGGEISALHLRLDRFALAALSQLVVACLILVQGLKVLWGRTRFRDLDASFSAYTPWYLPQGPTGEMSFPSGHTAFGWMLLPLVFLIPQQRPDLRALSLIFVAAWGLGVAAMRVRVGAHYVSDVAAASLISLVVWWASGALLERGALASRREAP